MNVINLVNNYHVINHDLKDNARRSGWPCWRIVNHCFDKYFGGVG